jgi:LacI family transcriptional regulator
VRATPRAEAGARAITRRTTIVDIAKAAGVSPKTVSRVLNDEPHVKPAVRERVKEAARVLDYLPNVAARGLITRKSYLIGLTYERPSPSYVVELQRGALERLEGERYRLVVLPFHDASARQDELTALLRSASLDGVILAPPSCDLLPVLDALDKAGIRYARIAPHLDPQRGVSAAMDDVAAARALAEHLLALGHRRFGIILGDPTHYASEARLEGYRQALEAAGIAMGEVAIEQGDFTYPSGEAAAARLLGRADRPTAILAQNDDMAVAAIQSARDLGLDVPRDLSVAGFDDSEVSRLVWPRLTTVRQPVFEMARDATDRLVCQLEEYEPAPPAFHPHELMVRGSTAAPPDGG